MKARIAPVIGEKGLPGFLLWARRDSPVLYGALVREFPEVAAFEAEVASQGIGGIMDVLSSVGSSLKSVAGKVGKFVQQNAVPLIAAAVPVVVATKQAKIAQAQVRLAEAQLPPAQVAYATTPEGYEDLMLVQPRKSLPVSVGAMIPAWVWWASGIALAGGVVYLVRNR